MGSILEKIEQALKDMLIGWIESNLTNMFTDVNEKVGTIAAEVGQTPSGWNGGVYQMIRGLSENVIVPIAGKTAQAQMLILELLADGKRMPSAELEKTVNERGISSRTMRTAKSRIGDRLVTEKDGTAWVCYLRD